MSGLFVACRANVAGFTQAAGKCALETVYNNGKFVEIGLDEVNRVLLFAV